MTAYLVNKRLESDDYHDIITVFVTISKEKALEEATRLLIINYEDELAEICKRPWMSLSRLDDIRKSVSYDPEQNSLDLTTFHEDYFSLEIEAFRFDKRYANR